MDLNVDSELIDVYIVQADDRIGDGDTVNNHILDVYFNDYEFDDDCEGTASTQIASPGLTNTGMSLTETGIASGVFTGTFQIPENVCADTVSATATGTDIFVNYWDYRDAGGNQIEVGDAATVTANSGSVTLDRSVYPVPFDASTYKAHDNVMLSEGNITLYVQVHDADYDQSPTGIDTIAASADSITVSAPWNIAVAISFISALVAVLFSIILSNICVATITGLKALAHFFIISNCTFGTCLLYTSDAADE